MNFLLKQDKLVFGEKGNMLTFIEAGVYPIIRQFDKDRIIVKTNSERPRQITLLRFEDGELRYE